MIATVDCQEADHSLPNCALYYFNSLRYESNKSSDERKKIDLSYALEYLFFDDLSHRVVVFG